jgi:hypothetical protein
MLVESKYQSNTKTMAITPGTLYPNVRLTAYPVNIGSNSIMSLSLIVHIVPLTNFERVG